MTEYDVILADPPWQMRDALPGKTRGASKQYPTIHTNDLLLFLEQHEITPATDALLFLWRLSAMQLDALRVIKAWGFVDKSEFVWRKLTHRRNPHFGMGRYVRMGHETCIIAARGKAQRLIQSRSVQSVFEAPMPLDENGRKIHSAKPDEQFTQVIEPLIGGADRWRCIELFARRRRQHWDAIGNDLPERSAA